MIYKILAAIVLLAPVAHAEDEFVTVLNCSDARPLADAGYQVVITEGGLAGIPLAHVSEQTFAGPRSLGSIAVKELHRGPFRYFQGEGFSLKVSLVPSVEYPYGFLASFSLSQGGLKARGQLICTLNDQRNDLQTN